MLKSKLFTVAMCAVMGLSGMALADEGAPDQAEPQMAVTTVKLDRVLARETGILLRLNLSAEQERQVNQIRRSWAAQKARMVRYRNAQKQALEALKAAEQEDPGKVEDLRQHLKQVRKAIAQARKSTWVPLIQVLNQGQRGKLARILRAEFGARYVAEVRQMVRAAVAAQAAEAPADSGSPSEEEMARAEQERIQREEAERAAQAEQERIQREEAERAAQAEQERIQREDAERERAERERHEAEQAERERIEREAADQQAASASEEGAEVPGSAEGDDSMKQEMEQMRQAYEDLKRLHAELLKAFAELQDSKNVGQGEPEPEAAPENPFEDNPAEIIDENPEQESSDK
jgi:hypothetical protein